LRTLAIYPGLGRLNEGHSVPESRHFFWIKKPVIAEQMGWRGILLPSECGRVS